MKIFRALHKRPIRWLWGGQVFSAIGDEVYSIALVWYATSLLGKNAGYLAAIQAASVFVFSLIGGVWADHRDHRRVMIFADIMRGLAILALPVMSYLAPLSLPVVIVVVIVVSSLAAFFNPALNAFLPQLTGDKELLQSANGLMETTSRFARVLGPGLVGLLSRQIPLIHYFTLDAFSFFVSAYSISRLKPDMVLAPDEQPRLPLKATLLSGFYLTNSRLVLAFTVYSGALSGAAWIFVLPLGMTLLIRERLPTNVGALGFLISAYGVGNIVSNLVISNFHFRRPERWVYSGRLIAGIGIMLLSLSHSLQLMMVAAAITAVGGPLTDLGFVNLIQSTCKGRDIARLFRYITALGQGSLLIVYAVSPKLLHLLSVQTVLALAGVIVFVTGALGFALSKKFSERAPGI